MMFELRKLLDEEYWWPKTDTIGWAAISGSLSELDEILPLMQNKRIAVQAGGNCGLWPIRMSKEFETVITFEPSPLLFSCLQKNIEKHTAYNINANQCALSDSNDKLFMSQNNMNNLGCSFIINKNKWEELGCVPKENRVYDIKNIQIDDLNLNICDFIQLDIEGYETFALMGAEETIKRCRPVVMLEINGCSTAYNIENNEVIEAMYARGYELKNRFYDDYVFVPL